MVRRQPKVPVNGRYPIIFKRFPTILPNYRIWSRMWSSKAKLGRFERRNGVVRRAKKKYFLKTFHSNTDKIYIFKIVATQCINSFKIMLSGCTKVNRLAELYNSYPNWAYKYGRFYLALYNKNNRRIFVRFPKSIVHHSVYYNLSKNIPKRTLAQLNLPVHSTNCC